MELRTISLVIITKHRPGDVNRLLTSLPHQTRSPNEVLVVDASEDSRTEQVVTVCGRDSLLPNLHYFRMPPGKRQKTQQRNFGALRACFDIIDYLDDDTIPDATYFEEILDGFERHPETVGVAGFIRFKSHPESSHNVWFNNVLEWRKVTSDYKPLFLEYRHGNWVCRAFERTNVLKVAGLTDSCAPGCMLPSGYMREFHYIPPDGQDHLIECCSGAAMNWRRDLFKHHRFSPYFTGYAPFEEFEFCFRTLLEGPIYMATRARVTHFHAPTGRPGRFHYGFMWVRNSWFTWRQRWSGPRLPDRIRWYIFNLILILCRCGDAVRWHTPWSALTEAAGRTVGLISLLVSRPVEKLEREPWPPVHG